MISENLKLNCRQKTVENKIRGLCKYKVIHKAQVYKATVSIIHKYNKQDKWNKLTTRTFHCYDQHLQFGFKD